MSKKAWIIPSIVLLAAAGLLFGIAGHWTSWQGSRPDQVTDDAYLKADITPLSTRIKIVLFPGQPDLDRLRPGFSAVVIVHTGKAGDRSVGDR